MSIFKSRIVTFLVALFCIIPFSLAFVACGDDPNKNNNQQGNGGNSTPVTAQEAKQVVTTQLNNLSNGTFDITMAYAYQTIISSEEVGDSMHVKTYLTPTAALFEEYDSEGQVDERGYLVGSTTYTAYTTEINEQSVDMVRVSSSHFDMAFSTPEGLIGKDAFDAFSAIAAKFSQTPVQVVEMDGKVTYVISANMATFLDSLLTIVKENYQQPLSTMINKFIDFFLDQPELEENEPAQDRVTIESIINGLTADINNETTIGDLVDAVEEALNTTYISQIIDKVAEVFGQTAESVKALTLSYLLQEAPFYEYLVVENETTGDFELSGEAIAAFILGYLDDNSLEDAIAMVINMFIAPQGGIVVNNESELSNKMLQTGEQEQQAQTPESVIEGIFAMLEPASITNATFTVSYTYDRATSALTAIDYAVAGALSMTMEGQTSVFASGNATISVIVSNIGTTTIALPEAFNTGDLDIVVDFDDPALLNENEDAYVIALPTTIPYYQDFNATDMPGGTVVATYDKATNSLTLSKEYADLQLQYGYISLYANGGVSYFNIEFVQEDKPALEPVEQAEA